MIHRIAVVLGIAAALALSAGSALAQYTQPTVSPTITTSDAPPSPTVLTTVQGTTTVKGTTTTRGIAITGADVAWIAIIGAGTVALGSVLVVGGRRRPDTPA